MVFVFYDDHFSIAGGAPSTKHYFTIRGGIDRSSLGSRNIDSFMFASVSHPEPGSQGSLGGPDEKTFAGFDSRRCFLFSAM